MSSSEHAVLLLFMSRIQTVNIIATITAIMGVRMNLIQEIFRKYYFTPKSKENLFIEN